MQNLNLIFKFDIYNLHLDRILSADKAICFDEDRFIQVKENRVL